MITIALWYLTYVFFVLMIICHADACMLFVWLYSLTSLLQHVSFLLILFTLLVDGDSDVSALDVHYRAIMDADGFFHFLILI